MDEHEQTQPDPQDDRAAAPGLEQQDDRSLAPSSEQYALWAAVNWGVTVRYALLRIVDRLPLKTLSGGSIAAVATVWARSQGLLDL